MDERRGHILRAAEICFARDGFHSTTIADVREEAGVSTGAIYTYFPNKEAMIRALLEMARDERRRQLEGAMNAGAASTQAVVLLDWVNAIFSVQGRHAARVDVNLWAEALRSPSVKKLAQGALQEATTAVSAVVASELASSGMAHPPDAASVASVLIALFLGLEVQTAVGIRLESGEVLRVLAVLFADYLSDRVEPKPPAAKRRPARTRRRT